MDWNKPRQTLKDAFGDFMEATKRLFHDVFVFILALVIGLGITGSGIWLIFTFADKNNFVAALGIPLFIFGAFIVAFGFHYIKDKDNHSQ